MTLFDAVVLGVTQGLTEFLPISSDGHLSLVFIGLGIEYDQSFIILLHFATLLAIVAYFWRDVLELASSVLPKNRHRVGDRRLVALILIGTFVSGLVALGLKDIVEPASKSLVWIGAGFLFTTAIMTVGELLGSTMRRSAHPSSDHHASPDVPEVEQAAAELPFWKALPIGLAQGLAVLPGVSRSGSTIASGMLSGLRREDAAKFSFLLGIPIITLAAVLDATDLVRGASSLPPLSRSLAGFAAAGLSGYFAIWWLLRIVKKYPLYWFAAYTGVLGVAILYLGISGRG